MMETFDELLPVLRLPYSYVFPRYLDFEDALQAGGAGADQRIEMDVTQVDGGPNNAFGVSCRVGTDGTNRTAGGAVTAAYELWAGSDGTAGINKLARGSDGITRRQTLAHTDIAVANSYHLRADCNGSRLTVFVDGVKALEAQDSDYKSGSFGLYASTNEPTGIEVAFANLTISRP